MIKFSEIVNNYPSARKTVNSFAFPVFYLIRIFVKLNKKKRVNIVVVSLHKLGDTVFTIPAIQEIIRTYKKNIYIICFPESKIIYGEVLAGINYVVIEKAEYLFKGRLASRGARKKLRNIHPKIIFDLTASVVSAFLIFNSRAKTIAGSNDEHYRAIYTHFNPVRKKPHLIERYFDAVSSYVEINRNSWNKGYGLDFNKDGVILIHPFGGWDAKMWSLKKFIQLAKILNNEFKIAIIIPDKYLPMDILNEINFEKIKVIETKSVSELINQIKECSVFIGNDSGPLYMADLLGKPTFTVYGPTNPAFSLPMGEHNKFIKNKLACSPEQNKQYCFTGAGVFGCPAFQCMNLLSFNSVYSDIIRSLEQLRTHRHN